MSISTVEELEEKLRDGWTLYRTKKDGKWWAVRKGETPQYIKKAVVESAPEYFQEKEKKTEKKEKGKGKSEEKSEKCEKEKKTTVTTAPLRILDRSYAEILTHLTTKLDWFSEVMTQIGFTATMIALQAANISVSESFERIEEFRDNPQAFVQYIDRYLSALWKAKEEAQNIVQLEEERDKLALKLYIALTALENLKKQRDEYYLKTKVAISCMCPDCLRRHALATAFADLSMPEKKKTEVKITG